MNRLITCIMSTNNDLLVGPSPAICFLGNDLIGNIYDCVVVTWLEVSFDIHGGRGLF